MKICFYAPVRDIELLDRVEFYKQDIDALRRLGHEVRLATRICELVRSADVYFVWWWTWAFLPLFRAKLGRKPCIITGVFDYCWPVPGLDYLRRPLLQKLLLKIALRYADWNIFVSKHEFDSVPQALPVHGPKYIPLGVDTEVYCDINAEREAVIFTVAWLTSENARRKCIDKIIIAAPEIVKRVPNVRIVIAGEKASGYEYLFALAEELGVTDAIQFLGVITKEEKIRRMQRCAVYLQPSQYEGFGLGILEAMSCGAPIVSSPVGAVPEVVGDCGLLISPDSSEGIAKAAVRFLNDPAERALYGRKARERAERMFSVRVRELGIQAVLKDIKVKQCAA